MSTAILTDILKQLIANGMKACIFALKDGLPLTSQKVEEIDDNFVSAMGVMLAETSKRVTQGVDLSEFISLKLVYKESNILCRNITVNENSYLLGCYVDKPISEEVEKYNEQLLDWAVENGTPILEKLSSL